MLCFFIISSERNQLTLPFDLAQVIFFAFELCMIWYICDKIIPPKICCLANYYYYYCYYIMIEVYFYLFT